MKGWLLDTNVIASLTAPNGAPSVKTWARAIDERDLGAVLDAVARDAQRRLLLGVPRQDAHQRARGRRRLPGHGAHDEARAPRDVEPRGLQKRARLLARILACVGRLGARA